MIDVIAIGAGLIGDTPEELLTWLRGVLRTIFIVRRTPLIVFVIYHPGISQPGVHGLEEIEIVRGVYSELRKGNSMGGSF